MAVSECNYGQGMGGGFSFSTDEQKTGLKWTDGKDIYAKTYTDTSINPSTYQFNLPTGYDKIVDWTMILDIAGNNNDVNGSYYAYGNPIQFQTSWTESGKFRLGGTFSTASSIHVTLYYTKS